MRKLDLARLGVEECTGADVFGGEMISPLAVGLIIAGAGWIVKEWPQLKAGFIDGFSGN